MTAEMGGANDTCLEEDVFRDADELLVEGSVDEVGVDGVVDESVDRGEVVAKVEVLFFNLL